MKPSTRQKMISGAADLIRRRGVNATSLRDVVNHTGTPRGSLAFHFPGGKLELLGEAIALADKEVAVPLTHLMAEQGPVLGLRTFINGWKSILETTRFEAGCTVLSVAIEPYTDDGKSSASAEELKEAANHLMDQANQAFQGWQKILAKALRDEGVPQVKAKRLAALCVASIEGTVAMCRAAKSCQALVWTGVELEELLEFSIKQSKCNSRT
jgi:AcrR family transcriptional regulator